MDLKQIINLHKDGASNREITSLLSLNRNTRQSTPSDGDLDVTDRLIQVGRIVKTPVFDHLIVTERSFLSFKDTGTMAKLKRSTKYVPTHELIERAEKKATEIAKQNRNIEIAKELKRNGMADEQIADVTGLPNEEVTKLKVRRKKA